MNEELKFNLVKEEGKAVTDLVIEERGYVNKFTWQEFIHAERDNSKGKKQVQAQMDIDQVAVDNILQHHAYISDLKPEQIHAIALYQSYDHNIKLCKDKLEEFEKADKLDTERKEEILKQIPELAEVVKHGEN